MRHYDVIDDVIDDVVDDVINSFYFEELHTGRNFLSDSVVNSSFHTVASVTSSLYCHTSL